MRTVIVEGPRTHERGDNERATDDQRLAEEEDDRARGIVNVQKSNHGRVNSQRFRSQFSSDDLVRSVVGVVAIRRRRILYGVEHKTDDVRGLELMLRALRDGVAGDALARDEQNGVAGPAHADGVGDGDHGRGVDDDPVEVFVGDAEHLLEAGAAGEVRGAVADATAGDEHEVVEERGDETRGRAGR